MMDIRPIKTEADYEWALAEIERYFEDQPVPNSPEGDRFDVLSTLVESYEEDRWPIDPPNPVEAIRSYMDDHGLAGKDLGTLLGSKPRASEVLNRRRRLTLDMVHKISTEWHIPADVLVQPYHLANEPAREPEPA